MKTHELKSHPECFQAMLSGVKRFDVRKDDRGFDIGDILHMREWHPVRREYTGRSAMFRVTYMAWGPDWGIPTGMVVMSCDPVEQSYGMVG